MPFRVKRWCKRLGIVAGVLVLLVVLFLVGEHLRGRWLLKRRLEALQARGEVLSLAALAPKRVPVEQNLAPQLFALSNELAAVITNLDEAPPTLGMAAPGVATVAWRLQEWSTDGKTTNGWTKFAPQLENAQPLFRRLHAIAQLPLYESGFDYHKGFVDFHLGPVVVLKRASQVLSLATVYELNLGSLEDAHRHLVTLVQISAAQGPEPLVICQLVRQACATIAFGATWQALQAPGWQEDQLASLQAAWERCDFAADMAGAFVMERALTLDFYDQIKGAREKLASAVEQHEEAYDLMGDTVGKFATQGWRLHWVNIPLWRFAWADQDELQALNRWQTLIERERVARSHSWALLSSAAEQDQDASVAFPAAWELAHEAPGWYGRFRFLFSSEDSAMTDVLIRRACVAQTQQQMVVAAIALKRYQLHYGHLPAELAALQPDYLKQLPRDAMDGKPLRYRLRPEGGFLLYSVGEDGRDDGGNPAMRSDKKSYRQIWDGCNAVWPVAAAAGR